MKEGWVVFSTLTPSGTPAGHSSYRFLFIPPQNSCRFTEWTNYNFSLDFHMHVLIFLFTKELVQVTLQSKEIE